MSEPLLLADRAAAALCGLSRASWHRLRAAGKLPPSIKLGRSVRWRADEIAAWDRARLPGRRDMGRDPSRERPRPVETVELKKMAPAGWPRPCTRSSRVTPSTNMSITANKEIVNPAGTVLETATA